MSKESKYRFAAFAGVLILVSGLVITLFDEASAVEMEFEDAPSTGVSGSTEFKLKITIPQGEQVPIQSIDAVIERRASGNSATGLEGKANADLVTRERCAYNPTNDCSSSEITTVQGTSGVITQVRTISIERQSDGVAVGGDGYFGACSYIGPTNDCDVTHTGYEFSSAGSYGYGVFDENLDNVGYQVSDVGFGYGYVAGNDGLVITLGITVDASQLSGGAVHYITGIAVTGSNVIGEIHSGFHEFTVSGGGGGGGGGGGAPDDGLERAFDAISVNAPEGALARYVAAVSGEAGQTITISFPEGSRVRSMTITLAESVTDMDLTVTIWPNTNAPPGVSAAPDGVAVAFYVEIDFDAEISDASLELAIPNEDVPNTDQGVFLFFDEGVPEWDAESRIENLAQDGDVHVGTARTTHFSVFAAAFDEEAPTVTLNVPSGDLSGTVELSAEAEDNLEVAKVEFLVDGNLVGTATSAPWTVSYDTSAQSDGDYEITAVAYDFVDNTGRDSGTSTFSNEDVDGEPGPGDGNGIFGGGDGPPWGTILIVVIILAIIGAAGYYYWRQQGGGAE